MPCTSCAGCGLSLDLAAPHITLVRQLEREQRGVVAVLDAYPVEYRHQQCAPAARRRAVSGADDQQAASLIEKHHVVGLSVAPPAA